MSEWFYIAFPLFSAAFLVWLLLKARAIRGMPPIDKEVLQREHAAGSFSMERMLRSRVDWTDWVAIALVVLAMACCMWFVS